MGNKKKSKNGSIYYSKKDNRFRCIYYITDKETLVEMRKTKSFISETDAKNFLNSIQCQKGNELYIKNNGIPLNQLLISILEKKLDTNIIKESQYTRLLYNIKNIEKAPFSQKNIEDITSEEIQSYLNALKDYSESTIKKITGLLKQAFTYALNKGYVTKNPMTDIIRPKSKQATKIVRSLTIEEQQQFTNYLTQVTQSIEPFKVAYLIQMYLGLRIGEVLALRNCDINLSKNLIKIDKTLTKDKNNKVVMGETTKTYAGTREVPIPHFIQKDIISQMKLAENHKDKLLFVDTNNNYMNPQNANRQLKHIFKTMEIEGISTHSLRHTYGTRCIEAGMRAVALQRLMGHTDISITLNNYASVFNSFKEAELEKVNEYYMNNQVISLEETQHLEKENLLKQIENQILELIKTLETSFEKNIISLDNYQENLEYLQKLKMNFTTKNSKTLERSYPHFE